MNDIDQHAKLQGTKNALVKTQIQIQWVWVGTKILDFLQVPRLWQSWWVGDHTLRCKEIEYTVTKFPVATPDLLNLI